MPKRASCLIIGRHPQVPREVKVVCKQLTGVLQLRDCCSHLSIRAPGNILMTPPEFEAAAGCSKGKNWKVSLIIEPRTTPSALGKWHLMLHVLIHAATTHAALL